MLQRSFVFLAFVMSLGTLSSVHCASTGTKHTVRGAICLRGARTLVVEESAALSGDWENLSVERFGSFIKLMY